MAVVDPNSVTTSPAATAPSARPLTGPPPSSSRPISPLPQQHPHHHYPSQALYTAQPLPIRPPNPHPNSQLSKPHDPTQGFLYPVASSGRGFISKGMRPDQMVTVANPGVYPPPLLFSHGVRVMNSPHLDYLNHTLHMTRPPILQFPHPGAASAPIKGVPVSAPQKTNPRSAVSDGNGYKNERETSRDDTLSVVNDRKVRITEDASLYALCRSWLRNGVYQESQLQQKDVIKTLPKPLPASMVGSYMPNKEEEDKVEEHEEDPESAESLSPRDLLKRHIKRAKKVRSRLREERLKRITRYRGRLRLLLPPPIEQFRNDAAAGN